MPRVTPHVHFPPTRPLVHRYAHKLTLFVQHSRHCATRAQPLPTMWMCKTCAFVNPSNASACGRCAIALCENPPKEQTLPNASSPKILKEFNKSLQNAKVPKRNILRKTWKCPTCFTQSHQKYACQRCATPREPPSSRFLQQSHSDAKTLWMCAGCLHVQTFDRATCGNCHETNDSFKVHGWTCRGCSKGHSSVESAKCCEFFFQPNVPYGMPWECPCGQKNAIVTTRCPICHRGKQLFCAALDDWVCQCGHLQPKYSKKCAFCAKGFADRIATWVSSYRPVLENWRCARCDVVNGKQRVLCRKCATTRRDASIKGVGRWVV